MNISRESIIALTIMTIINVLDYFHRYIPSTLKDLIKEDLQLSDFQTGIVYTSFIICYMIMCPLIGIMSNHLKFKRKYIIVLGIVIWSVATSLTGICNNFYTIIIPRISFGIGEAIYSTIGPALLCDYFSPQYRNIVMSIFYAATPIGCALGYIIAGPMGQYIGWRLTCIYLGIPGIISIMLLFVREPMVGEKDIDELYSRILSTPQNISYKSLLNWTYVVTVMGYIAVTFGMGGLSDWLPSYFQRYYNLSVQNAGLITGFIVVCGGLTGAIVGGLVSDFTESHVTKRHPYFLVSGLSMGICAIFATIALYCCENLLILVLIMFGVAVFFGWWYNGPINGIIQNCVPAKMRPQANGICVLFIHLFGDAISPSLIGFVADASDKNLKIALMMIPISFGISSLIWIFGWIFVPATKFVFTYSINSI